MVVLLGILEDKAWLMPTALLGKVTLSPDPQGAKGREGQGAEQVRRQN